MSEMSKLGELHPLKFPAFRRELLYQNHWNPGDDVGRIKIVISEGFPRDSPSNPIERVKNSVAFSFQHAPLGEHTKPMRRSMRVEADLLSLSFRHPRDQWNCLAQSTDVAPIQ